MTLAKRKFSLQLCNVHCIIYILFENCVVVDSDKWFRCLEVFWLSYLTIITATVSVLRSFCNFLLSVCMHVTVSVQSKLHIML
jgi:hypothetical protein